MPGYGFFWVLYAWSWVPCVPARRLLSGWASVISVRAPGEAPVLGRPALPQERAAGPVSTLSCGSEVPLAPLLRLPLLCHALCAPPHPLPYPSTPLPHTSPLTPRPSASVLHLPSPASQHLNACPGSSPPHTPHRPPCLPPCSANILFDELGGVKITDFGLSKVVEDGNTQVGRGGAHRDGTGRAPSTVATR
jgi:hypothetical protein